MLNKTDLELINQLLSAQLGVGKDRIVPEAKIVGDFGADPGDIYNAIEAIDSEFDIRTSPAEIANFKTVQDIYNNVENHMRAADDSST